MSKKEFEPYQPSNITLYNILYGKNLISLGGKTAIENMFSDLNLQNLNALDIGFGLGGVAFYLAEKYQMNIGGVEIHPWMVRYATEHTPENLSLQFDTYTDAGELPYSDETFDLVYSKGVFNHIANKQPLLQQIYRVLKFKGQLVIADWIFPHPTTETAGPLVCETQDSYTQLLLASGFAEIQFRDDSLLFLEYVREFLDNLAKNRLSIEQQFDADLYVELQNQHTQLINQITHRKKIAVRIVAKKISDRV